MRARRLLHAGVLTLAVTACQRSPEPPQDPAASVSPSITASVPSYTPPIPAPVCVLPTDDEASSAARACARQSADAGIRYLRQRLLDRPATSLGMAELNSLAVIDYLARRWDIDELRGARALALSVPGVTSPHNPEVGFWRARVTPLASVTEELGQLATLESRFLYCDTLPLTAEVAAEIADGLQTPYGATHILWWLSWADELGCRVPAGIEREEVVDQVVADFRVARNRADVPAVNDLSIEQGTLLAAAGSGHRVPAGWTARLVAAQLPDGSWHENLPGGGGTYNWHPTMLAVWYLLTASDPGTRDPGFLAERRERSAT